MSAADAPAPVRVRQRVVDEMIAHAREMSPLECCGLLIGSDTAIETCWRAANLLASETRFRIEPADHFAAIRWAREAGHRVVGAYHSHPRAPAVPSETDRVEADGTLLHVIVGRRGGGEEVSAWRLENGNFRRIPLVPER